MDFEPSQEQAAILEAIGTLLEQHAGAKRAIALDAKGEYDVALERALDVMFEVIRGELAVIGADPARAALAKTVEEMTERAVEATQVLFSDIEYALLRAKLMIGMVIGAVSATELLRQAGADPSRLDLAEDWIFRASLESEYVARRIEAGLDGRLERDGRLVAELTS